MDNKIKAIIFDMDGVLIEAKDWHYEALNQALRLFGREISRYDHLTTFDGLPTKTKLEMLSAESHLPHRLRDIINELKQIYTAEIATTKCKPYYQHEYALSRLSQIDGFRLAVASNSIRATIELMLTRANLVKFLTFYLSNEDVSKPKPDPEIYLTAIAMLKLKPEECLIVEDNDKGIKAAEKSGANVMRVHDTTNVNYENIMRAIAQAEATRR